MQVLSARAAGDLRHGAQPEVIRVGTEHAQGLFEGQFYLEAQAVESNDLDWCEGQVGGDEDRAAAGGVIDEDEAHPGSEGSPEKVAAEIADRHVALTIDGAVSALPGFGRGIE
jgi:hypothetical protein